MTPEGISTGVPAPDGKQLAVQAPGGPWQLLTVGDAAVRPIGGLHPQDLVVAWSTDGRAVFCAIADQVPARLERVDIRTGARTLVKEIAPPELAGLNQIIVTSVINDGAAYAYGYARVNTPLFRIEGLDLER